MATAEAAAKPRKEMYSCRAKALLRVGGGDDAVFTRIVGMSLEIVPGKSPFRLGRDEQWSVRVYFHCLPLAGARVELSSLVRPADVPVAAVTDKQGRVNFDLNHTGSVARQHDLVGANPEARSS